MILQGNCLEKLKDIPDESVDAVCTDPPYELGFMGKKWDASGIAYNVDLWRECLRVLKPGGHLLAFGGTRTYHRMAVAIEDAGFEVRDMLEWIYFSGFPKSLNVGKAVDKSQGNKREIIDQRDVGHDITSNAYRDAKPERKIMDITKGNSEWEGFGTNLKPSHEPICMARKPLSEKTIVENVLKHGTGAIDIDGCRIPTSEGLCGGQYSGKEREDGVCYGKHKNLNPEEYIQPEGRFPANIICTDDALNDGVMTKSGALNVGHKQGAGMFGKIGGDLITGNYGNDSGSKSRYFDIDVWAEKHGLLQFPKASKRERNAGCEGMEKRPAFDNPNGSMGGNMGSKSGPRQNFHPTVKPVHLMSWLVRLVSKEGDTVLDPFMGSGTTGVACKKLNRNFIGIEIEEEYIKIAEARLWDSSQQLTFV